MESMKTKIDFRADAIGMIEVEKEEHHYQLTLQAWYGQFDECIVPYDVFEDWMDDNCPREEYPHFYKRDLAYECEDEYREGWVWEIPYDVAWDHIGIFNQRRFLQETCSMLAITPMEFCGEAFSFQEQHISGWVHQMSLIGTAMAPHWYVELRDALIDGRWPHDITGVSEEEYNLLCDFCDQMKIDFNNLV